MTLIVVSQSCSAKKKIPIIQTDGRELQNQIKLNYALYQIDPFIFCRCSPGEDGPVISAVTTPRDRPLSPLTPVTSVVTSNMVRVTNSTGSTTNTSSSGATARSIASHSPAPPDIAVSDSTLNFSRNHFRIQ